MFKYIDQFTPKQRAFILVLSDMIICAITPLFAFFLRFGLSEIAFQKIALFWWYIPLFVGIRIGTFQNFGIYTFLWRYASMKELVSVVKAITLSSLLILTFLLVTSKRHEFPASILLMDWAFNIITIGSTRIFVRLLKDSYRHSFLQITKHGGANDSTPLNLLIIGAGDTAEMITRELLKSRKSKYNLVGFVDDNTNKIGQNIHQVPVLGTTKDIISLVTKYQIEEAIIAMPSANGHQIRTIVELCEQAGIQCKITPALYDIINGKVSVNQLREVRIEDLLGREVIHTDMTAISAYLSNKTVLVTGAGGSIGSELCRQILKFSPSRLLIVDHSENNVYHIDLELRNRYPKNPIIPLVADIKNKHRMTQIFTDFQPQIIFHAAAYKHVPLMEDNVSEAILNNIMGTKQLLDLADTFGVERCVLISTDKAVHPTNCMGATKRISEVLMQLKAKKSKTTFAAVRFGNVLGSEGSVVPLFKKQIAQGGPVTITHPDVTRFFMTIPEAVGLVIQAGAYAEVEGGEIFVLDMGEPIKIVDLAKDMIHLSGLELGRDIEISYVGLRPGEKLYEELFYQKEGLKSTEHQKIFISEPSEYAPHKTVTAIEELIRLSQNESTETLRSHLLDLVTQLQPNHKESNEI